AVFVPLAAAVQHAVAPRLRRTDLAGSTRICPAPAPTCERKRATARAAGDGPWTGAGPADRDSDQMALALRRADRTRGRGPRRRSRTSSAHGGREAELGRSTLSRSGGGDGCRRLGLESSKRLGRPRSAHAPLDA